MKKLSLTQNLDLLATALTDHVVALIKELTLEELLALTGEDVKPEPPKPRPRKKKPRQTVKTKKQTTPPTVEAPKPKAAPEPARKFAPIAKPTPPARDKSVPSYRKEQEARLEKAVLDFISANPGADAGLVSMKIGVPVSKAQGLLDGFVLKGKMTMESGQHGRCYKIARA